MKKIFTLISVAFVAMSVNAKQAVKTFSVSNGDFTTDKLWQYVQVKDGEKAVANFEILSSPNRDQLYNDNRDQCNEGTTPTFDTSKYKTGATMWDVKNSANISLAALNELYVTALIGKGNPQFDVQESWEYGSSGWSFKVNGQEWTEGCGALPGQGTYLRITPIVDGTLEIGVYINKGNHPLYIIDESTKDAGYTLLPVSAVKVTGGYINHYNDTRNYKTEGLEAYQVDGQTQYRIPTGKTPADLVDYLNEWEMPEDRILQHQAILGTNNNAPFMAIVEFEVKKGVSYIIMSPRSQVGFYGFTYAYDSADAAAAEDLPTPKDPTGIEAIKAAEKTIASDAAIYNLAGQKVDADYKGIVIQNGVKRVQK